MNYWIIASDGNCYGPADDATIRRWISEGRVIAQTPVGHSKDGPWTEARLVPSLAALFPPTAPSASAEASAGGASAGGAAAGGAAVGGGWTPPTNAVAPDPNLFRARWPMGSPPAGITIPILVSGILNLLFTLGWLSTCFLAFIGIPLLLLAIFEFVTYSQASTMEPERLLGRAKVLGILGICTIVLGNIGSMVCGIVILTQLAEARAQLARRA